MGCLKIAIADDNENMLRALGQVINGEKIGRASCRERV